MTELQKLISEALKFCEQDELARKLGCAQSTISYWKTGKRKPNERHLPVEIKKLKDLLNSMNVLEKSGPAESSDYSRPYPWTEGCRDDLKQIKETWKTLPAAKRDEYKVAVRVIYPKISEQLIKWWEMD